ncbi:MAG: hypothetical protein K6A41_10835 [Bacteroidales bacterium]|nr:hypothetical protein [Bacteroidales bacterium]
MSRRKTINVTGISQLADVDQKDIWLMFVCVQCRQINLFKVGQKLLTPEEAYNYLSLECKYCGYVHSKYSDLPLSLENWQSEFLKKSSINCERFWKAFFREATSKPENYWKQCKTCGRILPSEQFAKHTGKTFGVLEKQLECKSCKAAINAKLNPKRTPEQLREGGANRRLGDLLAVLDEDEESRIDIQDLFNRFGSRCFKTKKLLDINNRSSWHVDHILPAKYFYPLTIQNAALLSSEANEQKKAKWPSEFYSEQELVELSKITGADLGLISSKKPVYNTNIDVNAAIDKFLNIRNNTNLPHRVEELRTIITKNHLIDYVSDVNKKILGLV